MDSIIVNWSHRFIDDLSTLSSVLRIYLSARFMPPLLLDVDNTSSAPTPLTADAFFDVLALLLEGEDAWNTWLEDHVPAPLLRSLLSRACETLPRNPYASSHMPTRSRLYWRNAMDTVRVLTFTIGCTLCTLPLWSLTLNHCAGVSRTSALSDFASSSTTTGGTGTGAGAGGRHSLVRLFFGGRSGGVVSELRALASGPVEARALSDVLHGASNASRRGDALALALKLGRATVRDVGIVLGNLLKGWQPAVVLGLVRGFSVMKERLDGSSSDFDFYYFTERGPRRGERIPLSQTNLLEGGERQTPPRGSGSGYGGGAAQVASRTEFQYLKKGFQSGVGFNRGGRPASGNVYYDDGEDDASRQGAKPYRPSLAVSKGGAEVSILGRIVLGLLLHPFELLAVRMSSSPYGAGYDTLGEAIASSRLGVHRPNSLANLFQSYRSCIVATACLPAALNTVAGPSPPISTASGLSTPFDVNVDGGGGGRSASSGGANNNNALLLQSSSSQASQSAVVRLGRTFLSVAFWASLSVPLLLRVRRMLPTTQSDALGGTLVLLNGLIASGELLPIVVSTVGFTLRGGLLAAASLMCTRIGIGAVLGDCSSRGEIRRIRRDVFIRAYFEERRWGRGPGK